MILYSYTGINKIKQLITYIVGVFSIVTLTGIFIFLIFGITTIPESEKNINPFLDARMTLICIGLWCLMGGWVIGFIFINYLPNVWASDEGLFISFFIFSKKFIAWRDVIDIGFGNPPNGYLLIRTKKITKFHIIYGWKYSYTLHPSFLIHESLINKRELLTLIRKFKI